MVSGWGDQLSSIFTQLSGAAVAIAPAIASIGQSLAVASAAIGISGATADHLEALTPIIVGILVPAIQRLGELMSENQGVVTALVVAYPGSGLSSCSSGCRRRWRSAAASWPPARWPPTAWPARRRRCRA